MNKKEIYRIIDAEVEWCKNNRSMPEDWHAGFINGLKQAKRLIKSAKVNRPSDTK